MKQLRHPSKNYTFHAKTSLIIFNFVVILKTLCCIIR